MNCDFESAFVRLLITEWRTHLLGPSGLKATKEIQLYSLSKYVSMDCKRQSLVEIFFKVGLSKFSRDSANFLDFTCTSLNALTLVGWSQCVACAWHDMAYWISSRHSFTSWPVVKIDFFFFQSSYTYVQCVLNKYLILEPWLYLTRFPNIAK